MKKEPRQSATSGNLIAYPFIGNLDPLGGASPMRERVCCGVPSGMQHVYQLAVLGVADTRQRQGWNF